MRRIDESVLNHKQWLGLHRLLTKLHRAASLATLVKYMTEEGPQVVGSATLCWRQNADPDCCRTRELAPVLTERVELRTASEAEASQLLACSADCAQWPCGQPPGRSAYESMAQEAGAETGEARPQGAHQLVVPLHVASCLIEGLARVGARSLLSRGLRQLWDRFAATFAGHAGHELSLNGFGGAVEGVMPASSR